MRRRDLLIAGAALAGAPALASAQPAARDPKAWALADELIAHMGGARVWANAVDMRIEEFAQGREDAAPQTVRFIRDLARPRIRIDTPGRAAEDILVLSDAGWVRQNGVVIPHAADRNARFLRGWPGNIYVLYRRFARQDPNLQLTLTSDRAFEVAENGVRGSWIELGRDGSLLKWRRYSVVDPTRVSEEWVYGMSRSFGPLRMPSWGALIDGAARFEYRDIRLSERPPADELFRA